MRTTISALFAALGCFASIILDENKNWMLCFALAFYFLLLEIAEKEGKK